jgi:hypothetical protein
MRKGLLIPIARYLCRRKNPHYKDKEAHRTFSLLPSSVIPYKRYDVYSTLFIADGHYRQGNSNLTVVLDLIGHFEPEAAGIDVSHIPRYIRLFESVCRKLSIYLQNIAYTDPLYTLSYLNKKELKTYALEFYEKFGKYLFGTPSQDR